MRTQDSMFVTQSTIDQKKNGRQVISSQITKDSASTNSARGFVLILRVGRRGRSMKSRPELLSGTCCRGHNTDGFRNPESNYQLKQLISVWSGTWNRKLKSRTESDRWDRTRMAESGTDLDPGIGTGPWPWPGTGTGDLGSMGSELVVDPETGTYVSESDRWDRTRRGSGNLTGTGPGLELDRNLTWDWNWTGTWPGSGTGQVSRIDGIGLVVDPETWPLGWNRELTAWTGSGTLTAWTGSGTSTAWLEPGLTAWLRSGTSTAWLDPGPRLLGWIRDLELMLDWNQDWLLGWIRNLNRLAGSGNFDCLNWIRDLDCLNWNQELDCLAVSGTLTAWVDPGPRLLG